MKKINLIALITASIFLSACSTMTPNSERAKALALASENSAGVLAIASLPLQYYCANNNWPESYQPTLHDKKSLISVTNLQYQRESIDYGANFNMRSFLPGDDFVVPWHMTISKPKIDFQHSQTIEIALESDEHSIFIPFNYQFVCTDPLLLEAA